MSSSTVLNLSSARKELERAQLFLNAILESHRDTIVFAIDKDYNYLFLNNIHKKATQKAYCREIAVGMNMLEHITDPEDRKKAKANFDRVFEGEAHTTIEEYGETVRSYFETFYNPVYDETGVVIAATALSRDVTEKVRSEQNYQMIFRNMLDGFALHQIICDQNGVPIDYRFIDVNPSFEKMTGLKRETIVGKRVLDVLPGTEKHWIETYGKVALTGEPVLFENYAGELGKYFEVTAFRPAPNHFTCIFTDITERKQIEQALSRSEALLETTGQMARVGGWELDTSTNEVIWTKETYRIHEVPFDEKPPLERALDFWHPEDRPILADAIERARTKGEPYDLRLRFITARGRQLHAHTICKPIVVNGNVVKLQGSFQDITEMEHLQSELESLFGFSNALICIADINSASFIRTNPAFLSILGYTEEEMHDKPFADFIHPEDLAPTDRVVRETLQRGEKVYAFENRYRHKDGTYRWLLWNSSPIPEQGITYAIAIDITELKASQNALENTQRLESIGALAGGIAHDFNNLLGGIFGNIDLALEKAGNEEQVRRFLGRGIGALDRAKDLTQQLLTFSQGGTPHRRPVNICSVLHQSQQLSLSGSTIGCTITCDGKTTVVEADENQLSQVFNNVMINARQAMTKGGTLLVAVEKCTIASEQSYDLSPGEYLKIVFKDEGEGIPDSLIRKVFDPFFTTKSTGSGLGLATSYSIIRKHDGTMHIESKLGEGTTVTIYLPFSTAQSIPATTEEETGQRFSGRILLMDDEEVMRDVAQGMLELLGCEVICTREGKDAIGKFKEYMNLGKPFDAVILDLTVSGGIGGEQTVHEIRKIDMNVPCIVASGYADSPVLSNPQQYGFSEKIEKPFRKITLSKVLEKILRKKPEK